MARVNAPMFSFNQGEVSKLALGRVDVAKLRLAAAAQVNWTPWVLGPMMLRPGTIRIGETLDDSPTKLLRFVFAKTDVALLELTDGKMRVWVDEELVTRVAVTTTIPDPTFSSGTGWVTTGTTDGVTVSTSTGAGLINTVPLGGLGRIQHTLTVPLADRGHEHALRIVIANGPVTVRVGTTVGTDDLIAQTILDTGNHSLAFTPATANCTLQIDSTDAWLKTITSVTIEAAGAMEIDAPWAAADLPNVRYDQSGDIVFNAAHGLLPYRIERRGTRSWSVALYRSSDGPFQSLPSADVTLSSGGQFGTQQLTADRPFFTPDHVGVLYRLFISGQNYSARLGAANVFSPAVRIAGVGAEAREVFWTVAGPYVGTLTWQRSFDGPDSGFTTFDVATPNATGTLFTSQTGGPGGLPPLDNVVCWERVGFLPGNYTSGVAQIAPLYDGDGAYGIVRVTVYTSPTQVDAEVLQPLSGTGGTKDWVEQDWSDLQGQPDAVAFFDGRLFWFGRDKFWGSGSDDYTSFANLDANGNPIGDAGALNQQFGAGPVDTVCWGLGLQRLLAGREGSVASIRASAFDEVLTPTNISSKDCTTQGAARLPAVKIDTRGVYVQQSGRRVYELAFNSQALDYAARDLTRLNIDIGKPGFVAIDVQRQPDTNIHLVRTEGQVAVLLQDAADEIDCWTRFQTAGVVEDVCILPDAGTEDLVYYVVRRTIDGETKRFIERVAHRDSCVGGLLNVQADCCLSYGGAAVSSVEVPWLPNTEVVIWADGASRGRVTTDADGTCTMPGGASYSQIVVGLGGQVVIGSTSATLSNGNEPDQVFDVASNTLDVPAAYEGCPAEVFADIGGTGKPVHVGTVTVSGGAIALPQARTATTITACLGYVAPFMSAKLAYAAELGSALTQKKKIGHVGLVMQDTHANGLQIGQRFDALDPLPSIEGGIKTTAGTVWTEYDEPMIEVPGEWDTDARLCLLAQAPLPCTVNAVVLDITTNEK